MHHKFQCLLSSLMCASAIASGAVSALEAKSPHPGVQSAAMHQHPHAEGQTGADMQARSTLLKQAEQALATGKIDQATQGFEQAGVMLHAADAEMGLVRTIMQAGEYKRALAFAAHTAGAHLDEPEGTAFYAWLLHLGGQGIIAQSLLKEAMVRQPKNPLLAKVQQQLAAPFPLATGVLATLPTRFAPYGTSSGIPAIARVVSTGVLIDRGHRALVPLASVTGSSVLWVRNGVGQMAKATVERRLAVAQIAVLRLVDALPAADMQIASKEAFPGSIAYTIEYAAAPNAMPAWPMLSSGFLGLPQGNSTTRPLGIELSKGSRGGPVFDAAGRFTGIAIVGKHGENQFIPVARLRENTGDTLGQESHTTADPHRPLDQIYESALRVALQIIVAN